MNMDVYPWLVVHVTTDGGKTYIVCGSKRNATTEMHLYRTDGYGESKLMHYGRTIAQRSWQKSRISWL